jgi:uncharacterized protein YaaQ
MKMAMCVVHNRDKNRLSDELVKAGYKFTFGDSVGGFLREGNTTFMIGVEDDQLPPLMNLIETYCHQREQMVNFMPLEATPAGAMITSPLKVPVGGAVVFVLNVEHFYRF